MTTEWERDYSSEQAALRRQAGEAVYDGFFARGQGMTVNQGRGERTVVVTAPPGCRRT